MSANPDGQETQPRGWTGLPLFLLGLTVALPASLAAAHAATVADAAHDEAMLRAAGLGWTGALRALDAPWAGLFAWLPVGTRALRGALGSAAACGASAGILFVTARALLARCDGANGADAPAGAHLAWSARVGGAVAAIVALAATLSPGWQLEAAAPSGATLGAFLALAPVAILLAPGRGERRSPLACLALAAAISYEPLVGAAALVSLGAGLAAVEVEERRVLFAQRALRRGALAFALGLVPFALAFTRRASPLALAVGPLADLAGEHGESAAGMPMALIREDVGLTSALLVAAGALLALTSRRARPAAAALLALVCAGPLAMTLGVPAGPTRYGAPVLACVAAAYALAGVALQALVLLVARAEVPFARASAAMILVLEAALPARAADDASARAEERSRGAPASEAWDEAAWGALPAGSVVLVRDPRVEARLYSARASGELRADLALVPMFDLGGRGALRELALDPKLSPIWRDAALLGVQEEWSLSSLAQERPVVAAYDPAWDRALARHLVPVGLFARFEPEPRGGSDRRRALEDFSPSGERPAGGAPAAPSERDRLAKAADADPEILALTTRLLRARAIALAAASERDVVAHAIDDLRPFSARDRVATELVRRMAASHGTIDVKDLAP